MIEFFWINDTELSVNGEYMTPDEAYIKYPKEAHQIKAFVDKSKSHIENKHKDNYTGFSMPNIEHRGLNNLSIAEKSLEIQDTIQRIFKGLKLDSSEQKQKENAFNLFKYIIENSNYDPTIMFEKEQDAQQLSNDPEKAMHDAEIIDIHRCLCQHRSVCTSDAAALSLLFRSAGIPSVHLTIADIGDIPQGIHEVVSMKFDNNTFICDPTLTRTCLECGQIPDIHPSIFAFTPDHFFSNIYPQKEIKYVHQPINIETQVKSSHESSTM